ncbi:MAG: toll/interleukin-1 receptor domain-containing protein [Pseudomonadota bacterium]
MKIFVSHPHKQGVLAATFKQIICDAIGPSVEVFASSDIKDLPGGTPWRDALLRQLAESDLVLVLCSPDAIDNRWLYLEVGGAWALQRPVIPICHSGLSIGQLPVQFQNFNSLEVGQDEFAQRLLMSIGQHLNLHVSPMLKFSDFETQIAEVLKNRKVYTFDLFVSCPMSALDKTKYKSMQAAMNQVCDVLLERQIVRTIYCATYDKGQPTDFDHPVFGTQKDFAALSESSKFVLIYPETLTSSCLVEAGFALARKIPSVYFIRNPKDLPFALRGVDSSNGVRKQTYSEDAEIAEVLSSRFAQLFIPPSSIN